MNKNIARRGMCALIENCEKYYRISAKRLEAAVFERIHRPGAS